MTKNLLNEANIDKGQIMNWKNLQKENWVVNGIRTDGLVRFTPNYLRKFSYHSSREFQDRSLQLACFVQLRADFLENVILKKHLI